jgi:cysteinyl-tRNA synthetase
MAKVTGVRIYDTLSRELKEIVASNDDAVRIYCCGPTVYRDAHLGNLRTFLLGDLINRTLRFRGMKVRSIQNITDVGHMSEDFDEDKILAQAQREKRDPFSVAREYEAKFHNDLEKLNITASDHYPKASESIELMHKHIAALFELGLAYQGEDMSIYFDSQKFESYGELSGNRLSNLKPGHRYEYSEGGAKRFHADWALWKSAGNRKEMIWDSPWGPGFPGWHIECSAMSRHFLDGFIDLHIGGIDLRFPHHENERAQSNPLANGEEVVGAWLHGEHLLFEGKKMSKSSGNVLLLSDVIARGFDPLAVRFCFLENRYRSQMDLSWASIAAADKVIGRWREKYADKFQLDVNFNDPLIEEVYQDFANDLDTPRALQRLRNLEKSDHCDDRIKSQIFISLDPLLGLDLARKEIFELTAEQEELLKARHEARSSKNYAESDRIRNLLAAQKIEVSDSSDGQSWRKI